jgi:hypothetical protein
MFHRLSTVNGDVDGATKPDTPSATTSWTTIFRLVLALCAPASLRVFPVDEVSTHFERPLGLEYARNEVLNLIIAHDISLTIACDHHTSGIQKGGSKKAVLSNSIAA